MLFLSEITAVKWSSWNNTKTFDKYSCYHGVKYQSNLVTTNALGDKISQMFFIYSQFGELWKHALAEEENSVPSIGHNKAQRHMKKHQNNNCYCVDNGTY